MAVLSSVGRFMQTNPFLRHVQSFIIRPGDLLSRGIIPSQNLRCQPITIKVSD